MNVVRVEECMRLLREYEALLEEERGALISGDLAGAAKATQRKDAVIARLRDMDMQGMREDLSEPLAALEALSARQAENASLLREISSRLGEELAGIRARRRTMRAYGGRPPTGGAAFLNGTA